MDLGDTVLVYKTDDSMRYWVGPLDLVLVPSFIYCRVFDQARLTGLGSQIGTVGFGWN
jgi:hypothetical protein